MRRRSRRTWTSRALRVGTPCGHARTASVSRGTTAPKRSRSAAASDCSTGDSETQWSRWCKQPVGVEVRRDAVVFGPPLDRPPASQQFGLARARGDPVFETVGSIGRITIGHDEEPGHAPFAQLQQSGGVSRPVQDFDVHRCRRYESNVSLVLLRGDASGQVTGSGHDGRTEAATRCGPKTRGRTAHADRGDDGSIGRREPVR